MVKELKLNEVYLKQEDVYNLTSINLSDDLILTVRADKMVNTGIDDDKALSLSKTYIQKNKHKKVTSAYIDEDLVLIVEYNDGVNNE